MNFDFTCLVRVYITYYAVGAVFAVVIVVAAAFVGQPDFSIFYFFCFVLLRVITDSYHTLFAQLMIVNCFVNIYTFLVIYIQICLGQNKNSFFFCFVRHTGSFDNNGVN